MKEKKIMIETSLFYLISKLPTIINSFKRILENDKDYQYVAELKD